jgi:hypothetical protein
MKCLGPSATRGPENRKINAVNAKWDDVRDDGMAIHSLLRDRVVRIRGIAVWGEDDDGFGLEYEVIPAYDPPLLMTMTRRYRNGYRAIPGG